MAGATAKLIGEEKLLRLINRLPGNASKRRIWRSTARAAGNPIVKHARLKVPVKEGDLKRSIKYRNFSSSVLGGRGGYVGISHKSNSKTFTNPAKASVLVHNRKKNPLKKTHKNFITEAAREKMSESTALMEKRMQKFLEREIRKLL